MHWVRETGVLQSTHRLSFQPGALTGSLLISARRLDADPPQVPLKQCLEQHLIELSSLPLSPQASGQGDPVQCGHVPLPQAGSVENQALSQMSFLPLWEDFELQSQ